MKNNIIKNKVGIFIVLISIMLIAPTVSVIANQKETQSFQENYINEPTYKNDLFDITKTIDNSRYIPEEEVSFAGEQNDIGYNVDAANKIQRAS